MNIWSAFHSDTQSTNGNMNTETHISSLKHCGTFMCASFISTAGQRPWMLRTLSKCSFVQYQHQYVCISNVSVSIGYHHRFWPPPAADADLFWLCSLFRLCGWLCFLLRVVQIAAAKCWKRAFHSIHKYIIHIPNYLFNSALRTCLLPEYLLPASTVVREIECLQAQGTSHKMSRLVNPISTTTMSTLLAQKVPLFSQDLPMSKFRADSSLSSSLASTISIRLKPGESAGVQWIAMLWSNLQFVALVFLVTCHK